MMSNNPSSAPIQHLQYDSSQITQVLRSQDHEIGSNEHVLDIIPAGPYPATSMNHASAFPPARCSSTIVGYDDPPQAHLAMGPGEHQGIESQGQLDGHPTPRMKQRISFTLGPPQLEHNAPAITEVPNGGSPGQVPLPYNVAGPSRGNPSFVNFGKLAAENLKDLASHYLDNPGSHVSDLRVRRSRSGAVRVLILLEIDDKK